MAAILKGHAHALAITPLRARAKLKYSARDRRDDRSREQLLHRVRAEFQEMPGLRLTLPQAVRLFGVPQEVCTRVLTTLIDERTLAQGRDGRYARCGAGG